MNTIYLKLRMVFEMNNEMLASLENENLRLNISGKRSNTIGSQFYCIGGARESYGSSIMNNKGFEWIPSFSYGERFSKVSIYKYIHDKGNDLLDWLKSNELNDEQLSLALDLIAHEYQHQGQLIRYFYANDLGVTPKVKSFWHLED